MAGFVLTLAAPHITCLSVRLSCSQTVVLAGWLLPIPGLRWGSVWLAPEPVAGGFVRTNLEEDIEHARVGGQGGDRVALYEQALADFVRVLGQDHPQTLASRNNLAYAYQDAGDLGRAIPLYEQALADRQRVLGEDHPDTLGSRNNLAYAYQDAGDLGRAIPLYEQALADFVRVLGKDHPQTKIVRGNLAVARQQPQQRPARRTYRMRRGGRRAGDSALCVTEQRVWHLEPQRHGRSGESGHEGWHVLGRVVGACVRLNAEARAGTVVVARPTGRRGRQTRCPNAKLGAQSYYAVGDLG